VRRVGGGEEFKTPPVKPVDKKENKKKEWKRKSNKQSSR
jgi:hypothetical protein